MPRKTPGVKASLREAARLLGKHGGTVRGATLTAQELRDAARKAASARWRKASKTKRRAVGKMLADARAKARGAKAKKGPS